jgi:DNA ligase (NAD+)
MGKMLAKEFKTLDTIMALTDEATEKKSIATLRKLEGIGDVTAPTIVKGLRSMREVIDSLRGKVEILDVKEIQGSLTGKSFCLTGSFTRKKSELTKMIEAAGGTVGGSVKKGMNYLVQADPTSASGKTKKAQEYGVEIIDEDGLMELLA